MPGPAAAIECPRIPSRDRFVLEPLESRRLLSAMVDSGFGERGDAWGQVAAPGLLPIYGVVQVAPDQRITAVAGFTALNGRSALVAERFLPSGKTDLSLRASISSADPAPQWVFPQHDGKLLVVCETTMYRLHSGGRLDRSFQFDPSSVLGASWRWGSPICGAVLQRNGRILTTYVLQTDQGPVLTLVRYTPAGRPDPTFGNKGILITSIREGWVPPVSAPVAGNKILAFGTLAKGRVHLNQLDSSGNPDPAFGRNGEVTLRANDAGWFFIQPDGKILAVVGSANSTAVVRLGANGLVDAKFGVNGRVQFPFDSLIYHVFFQGDGKMIVQYTRGQYPAPKPGVPLQVCLARLNPDGSIDPTFAPNGVFIVPSLNPYNFLDAAQQGDNAIVLLTARAQNPRVLHLIRIVDDGRLPLFPAGAGAPEGQVGFSTSAVSRPAPVWSNAPVRPSDPSQDIPVWAMWQ